MIIENYKNLIVKKNNIKYPPFGITVNNSMDVPLIGYIFCINSEGKVECNYCSHGIGITKNTVIVINNNNEDKGEIGIYYSSPNHHYLYRSYNKMIIEIISYKYE